MVRGAASPQAPLPLGKSRRLLRVRAHALSDQKRQVTGLSSVMPALGVYVMYRLPDRTHHSLNNFNIFIHSSTSTTSTHLSTNTSNQLLFFNQAAQARSKRSPSQPSLSSMSPLQHNPSLPPTLSRIIVKRTCSTLKGIEFKVCEDACIAICVSS